MKKYQGIGVSGGITIGQAVFKQKKEMQVDFRKITDSEVKFELEAFDKVLKETMQEIDQLIDEYSFSKEDKDILTTHKMILKDPEFKDNIKKLIKDKMMGLETAIFKHFDDVIKLFKDMKNDYYSQRASDYEDVAMRLLSNVTGEDDNWEDDFKDGAILFINDIPPSKLTKLYHSKSLKGLCSEKGSKTSHSSIIARALDIPAIVGIQDLSGKIEADSQVIINANTGELIVDPDEKTIEDYKEMMKEEEEKKQRLNEIIDYETVTEDNVKVTLMNNIEFPEETADINKNNSQGIGSFRTKILYIYKKSFPSEDEQFKIYKSIAEDINPKPVIIRTIDLGGDKLSQVLNISKEENPYLGCRGIRVSLRHPDIFITQIKAILRASKFGRIKIMFPMISSIDEIQKSKKYMEKAKKILKKEKKEYVDNIEVGVMIEVPSAVIIADKLAKECDFFSLGTNDLVQYTLAVDRNSDYVSEYFDQLNPAVLRLIKKTVKAAHKEGIPVGICGEMASEKECIPLLLGLGLDELSVNISSHLLIKKQIRELNMKNAQKMAEESLQKATGDEVRNLIDKWRSNNEN